MLAQVDFVTASAEKLTRIFELRSAIDPELPTAVDDQIVRERLLVASINARASSSARGIIIVESAFGALSKCFERLGVNTSFNGSGDWPPPLVVGLAEEYGNKTVADSIKQNVNELNLLFRAPAHHFPQRTHSIRVTGRMTQAGARQGTAARSRRFVPRGQG